jgi:hypothetical protein
VISWGAQGGTGRGAFAPPSLYVKKGPGNAAIDCECAASVTENKIIETLKFLSTSQVFCLAGRPLAI